MAELPVGAELQQALPGLAMQTRERHRYLRLHFQGPRGIGKRRVAEALARLLDAPLLVADLARAPAAVEEVEAALTTLLHAAARGQSDHHLRDLARKITPRYTWDDLVLPADELAQLHEICQQTKQRHTVCEHRGFRRKLALGHGPNVLFSGPPGSGKTMAGDVIANEPSLTLYNIDLSQGVSKYIGETEKNLERIFTAAQNTNAILFFDEADALFGKRSEVRDAHFHPDPSSTTASTALADLR